MAKHLGRGIDSIIPNPITSHPAVSPTSDIALTSIVANSSNPRTFFDQETLEELADSIRQVGIIQPVTVRELDGKYQLISGERRYRAAQLAGLKEIPAFIRKIGDDDLLKLALLENIQRDDLNAIDIAISYRRMIDELSLTQEEVSRQVSKKRSTVANYLRLLKLPAEVQLALRQGDIEMGHARSMVNIDDPAFLLQLLNDIVEGALSVRQVERMVRQHTHPAEPEISKTPDATDDIPDKVVFTDPQPPTVIPDNEPEPLREWLSRYFSAKVDLKRDASTGAGRITIHFRTDDEFKYILQMAEKMVENG
ncbi:MAG: ParB/RepB/Spo0J family partition protein [Dysgonamonadaceae bacterium]|jgi:ParB family chromosome partitioning protein|nr:ParB/RepB/Spo0J family partition protein [Dysgonamonadaceae bacterium]